MFLDNFVPCTTCDKPVNTDLPAYVIIVECDDCEDLNGVLVFCSEECQDRFVPPSDAEMHEYLDD